MVILFTNDEDEFNSGDGVADFIVHKCGYEIGNVIGATDVKGRGSLFVANAAVVDAANIEDAATLAKRPDDMMRMTLFC